MFGMPEAEDVGISTGTQEPALKADLQPNEQTIEQGPASLHKNIETVSGELSLTNKRLFSEANTLNIRRGAS